MLPLLKLAGDGREHTKREAEAEMAQHFQLTEEERAQLLPSGHQRLFDNRVGWARTYLKQSGLLESVRRGVFVITERGRSVLARGLDKITVQTLEEFSEFQDFRSRARPAGQDDDSADGLSGSSAESPSSTQTLTPDEQTYELQEPRSCGEFTDEVGACPRVNDAGGSRSTATGSALQTDGQSADQPVGGESSAARTFQGSNASSASRVLAVGRFSKI